MGFFVRHNVGYKRLNKNLVRNTVSEIKKAGIEAVGFFMIGFPTETKKEIKEKN